MRRFELEDMLIRPGTYFNPQTEILVVVDDSPELDRELFDADEREGAEWVLVSDESPLDEVARDEALERFHAAYQADNEHLEDDRDDEDGEDELEPDEDAALEPDEDAALEPDEDAALEPDEDAAEE